MTSRLFLCSLTLALAGQAQSIDVGTGAPNEAIRQRFIQAFFRNKFYTLVAMPPLTPVQPFGGTGLIQIFRSATSSTDRLAIVKPNTSTAYPVSPSGEEAPPIDTFQVLAPMYGYYTSEQLGPGVVGFPTMDTSIGPANALGACQYQIFDKNYVLFVYPATSGSSQQNFLLRDPFYTNWTALGGIAVLGPAISNEATVTSSTGTSGAFQAFANGALVRITSGLYNGRTFVVKQPVWELYSSYSSYAGLLGFPISDELALADGRQRQNFEGGSIEYAPGSEPVLRLPVAYVSVQPAVSTVRLNAGDTLTLRATAYAANGAELSDRQLNWTTSNGRVVSLEVSGSSVTLKAVGRGVA
ncbi:MAG: LGFP repeat-containing protein, partial [Bryobacteraceae bacterium]